MIKVFVMETCPDCVSIKKLAKDNSNFQIIDIGEHVRNLKDFLVLRDHHTAFESVRQRGAIGIPCFVKENGEVSFTEEDFEELLKESNASPADRLTEEHTYCSLDGTGC